MTKPEHQHLKLGLNYWRQKTTDMSPEVMAWLDATRKRRLNLLTIIDEGMVVEELWQETAVLMINLFHFMDRHGYWTSWIPTIEKAITVRPQETQYELIRLKSQLSQLYRRSRRFEENIIIQEQVLEYAKNEKNNELIVSVYHNKTEAYIAQNQLDSAEENALLALKYLQNKQNRVAALIYKALGNINRLKGQIEEAIEYLKQAISIWEMIDDPYGFASNLNDLALAYETLGKYDLGLAMLDEALQILDGLEFQNLRLKIILNKGVSYYRQKNLQEAEKTFLVIDLFALKQSGEILDYAIALQNIGTVKLEQGKYEDSKPYILEAIKNFRLIKNDLELANSLGTLAEIFASNNEMDQAKLYFDEAIQRAEKFPNNAWGKSLLENFIQKRKACK